MLNKFRRVIFFCVLKIKMTIVPNLYVIYVKFHINCICTSTNFVQVFISNMC